MHRFAPLALATLLAASAPAFLSAQTSGFTDPANLRGERVAPLTGRELPIDKGTLGLEELLRKLNTRASILNIVAHPDDEDGGMLTLYSCGYGARVADLSLTRGEGGQNAMTGDFEDALGLLRTQELLSNDRYTGVTQMFGTEVDFGFSKTKTESFSKWGHDRVLYDAVRAIRLYRPLVITATFIGNPTDGHGQHQVSGEIAQEAFKAAGDPNVFPELTKEGILPWQPLKMYARVPTYAISAKGLFDYATGQYVPAEFTNYVTGKTSTTPPTPDITIHEGTTDPLLTTCAANPSDLPESLRSADSSLSSRHPSSFLSSFRNAGGSAFPSASTADCRPLSYVQFARIGLGLQRTQIGPGVRNASAGDFDVPYHLYGSRLCGTSVSLKDCHPERSEGPASLHASTLPLEPSSLTTQSNFFDGIDTSLEGLETLVPPKYRGLFKAKGSEWRNFVDGIQRAQQIFDPQNPGRCAPALADSLHALDQFMFDVREAGEFSKPPRDFSSLNHELEVKHAQLEEALAVALNIHVETTTPNANIIVRTQPPIRIRVTSTSSQDLSIFPIAVTTTRKPGALIAGEVYACMPEGEPQPRGSVTTEPYQSPLSRICSLPSRMTATITRPYFHRDSVEAPVYALDRADLRGAPATPPALEVETTFKYRGVEFGIPTVVRVSGQPVQIIPPASLAVQPHAQVLPNTDASARFQTEIRPVSDPPLRPTFALPKGWTVSPVVTDVKTEGFTFFQANAPRPPRSAITLSASVTLPHHQTYTEGYRPIGYGDLPRTNIYTPATDRIVPVDLKLPPANKRRIAYLSGTGDDVPAALASIGLKPTILTVADLTPNKLANFDTVILGVRTYNAHPDLHGAPTAALLDFARNGGNVLVQYQSAEFTAADAPYPLELGRSAEKVVDETAPVKILHAASTRFTTPNHINTTDFDHWIEERGHGFLGSWDPHYTALTETHDPGQLPQKGGLITVQLGRGHWTYCAFALYRQLSEAVPGAFRLFVNLLNP